MEFQAQCFSSALTFDTFVNSFEISEMGTANASKKEKIICKAVLMNSKVHNAVRRILAIWCTITLQSAFMLFHQKTKSKCCCGLTVVSRKASAGVTSCGASHGEIVNKLERVTREQQE